MEYIAYLHKDRKSDHGVSFPDFPGCITAGKTLEEARRIAVEALTFHVEEITENGESIPQPFSLDQLAKDPAMKGAGRSLSASTSRRNLRDSILRRAEARWMRLTGGPSEVA